MTDKELYLGIGLPVLAVLTSLIISLIQISGIREDMRQMRADFSGALAQHRHEAREDRLQIATTIGDIRKEAREDRLQTTALIADMRKEAREDRLRIDGHIELLTGKVYELMGQK